MGALNVVDAGIDPAKSSDDDLRAYRECYGLSFSRKESECMDKCQIRNRCIALCAAEDLGSALNMLGQDTPVPVLAQHLESNVETVDVLLRVRRGASIEDALNGKDAVPENPGKGRKKNPPREETPPPVPAELPAEEDVKKTRKDKKSKFTAADKAAAGKQLDLIKEPAKPVKTPARTKRAPPPVVAKAPAKKPAEAKKPASAHKEKKAAKTKLVYATVENPAYAVDADTAWKREKERSEWVGGLKTGQVFEKDYKGSSFRLEVKDGSYLVTGGRWPKGHSFPTVYATTVAIAGAVPVAGQKDPKDVRLMSKYSARRFWGSGKPKKAGKKK